jgi:hypothetical protein
MKSAVNPKDVFVETIARFLSKLELNPIILRIPGDRDQRFPAMVIEIPG